MYSGYGILFDEAGSWNFGNDKARNVIIFGFDNRSSSHTDNCRNNLSVLGEGPTYGINGNFGAPQKNFNINLDKTKTQFCISKEFP